MCGKKLTDPESIQRGFGPTCWAEMHPKRKIRTVDDEPEIIHIPGQMELEDWLREQDDESGQESTQQEGTAQISDPEL